MLIFPAVDLYNAQAVRLYKGDYEQMTVFSSDPAAVAEGFAEAGAEWIHVVDLEGARLGTTPNIETVKSIVKKSGLRCEIGGGIRTEDTVKKYIDLGVSRIILGTAAVSDRAFLEDMCKKYKGYIAVGADIKDGRIAVKGWTELSESYLDFCSYLSCLDIDALICTDISRDGAMRGTNTALYRELSERFSFKLIASGGVSTIADVKALAKMELYGAIIGKALYIGDIDLKEAISAGEGL